MIKVRANPIPRSMWGRFGLRQGVRRGPSRAHSGSMRRRSGMDLGSMPGRSGGDSGPMGPWSIGVGVGSVRRQVEFDPGSVVVRSGVGWCRSGVDLWPIRDRMGCSLRVFEIIWDRSGVDLGSTWGRSGIDSEPAPGRSGVASASIWGSRDLRFDEAWSRHGSGLPLKSIWGGSRVDLSEVDVSSKPCACYP